MDNREQFKLAFFPAHPAQFWIMLHVANALKDKFSIVWILRDKDVLLDLANKNKLQYHIISKAKTGLIGNGIELMLNIAKAIYLTKKLSIDLWFTKYGAGNIAARLLNKKSLSFNDDDIDVVPLVALTSYPFTNKILAPVWVRFGRYAHKVTRYKALHELIYLHPDRFQLDASIVQKKVKSKRRFLLVRLSGLNAHHDRGIKGISDSFLKRLVKEFSTTHQILITSESDLPPEYEDLKLNISCTDIHHFLAQAECLVTDSLSMAREAAILGTPTIRLSDFNAQISVFQALKEYQLITTYYPNEHEQALSSITATINNKRSKYKESRDRMISSMTDPLPIFINAIEDLLYSS